AEGFPVPQRGRPPILDVERWDAPRGWNEHSRLKDIEAHRDIHNRSAQRGSRWVLASRAALWLCGEIPRPSPIQGFPSEFQERKPCQGELNQGVRKVSRLHRVLGQRAPDYE